MPFLFTYSIYPSKNKLDETNIKWKNIKIMIYEIKPDSEEPKVGGIKIFLAGSIEQGLAEKWGSTVISEIRKSNPIENDLTNIIFFNPRRDDWDSSWTQEQSNPQFNHQVNWELNKLERCDVIFMYLSPETQSPISLLELGRYSTYGKMLVCCPKGFWRKGNVDILCTRENIPVFEDLQSAIGALKTRINQQIID